MFLALTAGVLGYTPRPATDVTPDVSSCVSISASADDAWCSTSCSAGNCPPTLCACGDDAKGAQTGANNGAAEQAAADTPEPAAADAPADSDDGEGESQETPKEKKEREKQEKQEKEALAELKKDAKSWSLRKLNKMYEEGKASNDLAKAGVLVHQHDNTENGWGDDAFIYKPGNKPWFATTIINQKKLKGLYNRECGIVIAPKAAKLLCSYYADFMSWNSGCERTGISAANGWHSPFGPPSRARRPTLRRSSRT
jgi:hypothetical protein